MTVYVITDQDIEALLAAIDRDPEYGYRGGSNAAMLAEERQKHTEAHRFFNFQIRDWIAKHVKGKAA